MRRRGRVDENHKAVVAALRAAGYSVLSLADVGRGCPDILAAKGGRNHLVEAKRAHLKDHAPGGHERETLARQAEWASKWNAPVHRVHSPEEAIAKLAGAVAKLEAA